MSLMHPAISLSDYSRGQYLYSDLRPRLEIDQLHSVEAAYQAHKCIRIILSFLSPSILIRSPSELLTHPPIEVHYKIKVQIAHDDLGLDLEL
jgi:hypothetical protein